MNNNIEKEFNQIREESKEGIERLQGVLPTMAMRTAWLLASRGQGGEQRVVRSEDDGTSPEEDSSAKGDDSASSSMETNKPMGRWPPCSPMRHASKEWLRPSKEVCTRRVCLDLASKDS